jgi:hypothetical protein
MNQTFEAPPLRVRRSGRLRLAVLAAGLCVFCAASVRAGSSGGLAGQLLDGSFRGSGALRGLLPERLLAGQEEPEATVSGDLDGIRGEELAVAWRGGRGLTLTVLGRHYEGAWRKLAEVEREFPGIQRLHFASFEPGASCPLLAQWVLSGDSREGQLEAFVWHAESGSLESALAVPATQFRLEDLDGDRVPELIVQCDRPGVEGVPEVYRWANQRFSPLALGLGKFYPQVARRFQTEGEAAVRKLPRGASAPSAALDNLLNAAKCLELAGQKSDAFRTYRRAASLSRPSLLRLRENDAEQLALRQRQTLAREGMSRLLGRPAGSEATTTVSTGAVSTTTVPAPATVVSTEAAAVTTATSSPATP